jgi:GT2 family glycosyltransferase
VTPRLSIVVPSYRRPKLLGRCLNALVNQRIDPALMEIVVADDAALGSTREQIEAIAEHSAMPLRYIPVTANHGPAAARNAGWRAARGDVIAFTDDDTIPDSGWAAAGLRAFERDPELAAATGCTDVPLPPRPTDYERNESGLATAEFITANCFIRRSVLAAIGGFDERFRAAWREDSDLHFTLLEGGMKVIKIPEAVVIHPVRPAPWGISLRMQSKSRYDALLFKKHPTLYRLKIGKNRPRSYYAIVAASLATGMGLSLGSLLVAATSGGIWAALTARFVFRRLNGNSLAATHLAEMIATSLLIPSLSLFWRLRGALQFRVAFY